MIRNTLLVLFALFSLWLPCGSCAQTTESTVTISTQDFNELRTALAESRTALTTAQTSLTASREALNLAKQQLTNSSATSTELQSQLEESQSQIATLKAQLTTQSQQIATLKAQLNEASLNLTEANQYLQSTHDEVNATIAEHEKTEKQLRRQIKGWQWLSVLTFFVGGKVM